MTKMMMTKMMMTKMTMTKMTMTKMTMTNMTMTNMTMMKDEEAEVRRLRLISLQEFATTATLHQCRAQFAILIHFEDCDCDPDDPDNDPDVHEH